MTSRRSEFKLIGRGFRDAILLLPGWASDYRIFDSLDLDYNYLVPERLSPNDFEEPLVETMHRSGLDKISILGWSLGGFLAAGFASNRPELVKEIILAGMRQRYEAIDLERIKNMVNRSAPAYLRRFYSEWFSASEEELYAFSGFKVGLMKEYLRDMPACELIEGLEYLGNAEIAVGKLDKAKTRFIHGENDRIAPINGLDGIRRAFSAEKFSVVKDAGHAVFLRKDFRDIFYGKQNK